MIAMSKNSAVGSLSDYAMLHGWPTSSMYGYSGLSPSSVGNCANVLSFGKEHRQGMATYCIPRCVTILRSVSRDPRRSTTILIPIFARVRNPSLEGC